MQYNSIKMLWCVLCHSSHSDESSSTVYVIQYIVQIFIAFYYILYHILYCIYSIGILLYLLNWILFIQYLFIQHLFIQYLLYFESFINCMSI